MVAVGALAEVSGGDTRRWAWLMFLRHHAFASIPLMLLAVSLGLGTPLGAGAFVLAAVPPAIGLPSNVAACGGRVRPVIQFTVISYGFGILITPVLVLFAVGAQARIGALVTALVVGLVLPAFVGTVCRPWLQRVPRAVSFAIVSAAVFVMMLGMGATLWRALLQALENPVYVWLGVALGAGRCLWAASLSYRFPPQRRFALEAALAGGGKNSVLAAVVAYSALGPLASLPAIFSLVAEICMLVLMGALLPGGAKSRVSNSAAVRK